MDFNRYSLLTKVGFTALTCNSALAIYRSRGDPASVAFVAGGYASLLLLFHVLRRYERVEADRGRTKAAVWLWATLVTAMFDSKVGPVVPQVVTNVVWMTAAASAAAGFWAFFLNP